MSTRRLSLEETWDALDRRGRPLLRDEQGRPLLHDHVPSISDDCRVGLSWYKNGVWDALYVDLTLPRIFMGRSSFERVSFRNSDISQSNMCWNDFDDCDFEDADLTCCDMRSSIFRRCRFVNATLVGADLRRSTFEDCDFTGADLTGAIVDWEHNCGRGLDMVDADQHETLDWRDDGGDEPPGG